MLALFRLLELTSGTMLISGVDLSTIPRDSIRSRLNAIPQEPYFIAGSMRLNIDPYEANNASELTGVLKKVHLWDAILSSGGLDAKLEVDSLSHGQGQLFCLARATLRKSKIAILDEVTSSVDRKTDELIQRIIKEEFKDCTIIAVAHRLDTILDFDRIAVLERGRVIECNSPAKLLAGKTAFKELYDTYSSSKREEGNKF
jgi:ATP-binding cassette subfamily C (CFTR/MRP) protein 1